MHPRDNDRLIRLLKNLRDIGNTVLVVEHDAEMMRSADHILDIGPAAGELGGRVMYEGDFKGSAARRDVADRALPAGDAEIKEPKTTSRAQKRRLTIQGAAEHNLKSIDVEIARHARLRHRRERIRKVDVDSRLLYAGLKKQRGEWQGHVGAFQKLEGGQLSTT